SRTALPIFASGWREKRAEGEKRGVKMNLGTASDHVSEGRSSMAIAVIRSAVEPVDDQAPAIGAIELSNELLRTISDVLDVRDVFPRIAQTANRLIQHDCLDLVV